MQFGEKLWLMSATREIGIRGVDGRSALVAMLLFCQQFIQRGQQLDDILFSAAVTHQPDPPHLAFERAEPGADFDVEPLE
jgi:hypothetical protein